MNDVYDYQTQQETIPLEIEMLHDFSFIPGYYKISFEYTNIGKPLFKEVRFIKINEETDIQSLTSRFNDWFSTCQYWMLTDIEKINYLV